MDEVERLHLEIERLSLQVERLPTEVERLMPEVERLVPEERIATLSRQCGVNAWLIIKKFILTYPLKKQPRLSSCLLVLFFRCL